MDKQPGTPNPQEQSPVDATPSSPASDSPLVRESGALTVVGFGPAGLPKDAAIADWQREVLKIVADADCRILAIDLTDIGHFPSRLMASLLMVRRTGVEIELRNPSTDLVELLKITAFGKQFRIVDVRTDEERAAGN